DCQPDRESSGIRPGATRPVRLSAHGSRGGSEEPAGARDTAPPRPEIVAGCRKSGRGRELFREGGRPAPPARGGRGTTGRGRPLPPPKQRLDRTGETSARADAARRGAGRGPRPAAGDGRSALRGATRSSQSDQGAHHETPQAGGEAS